MDAADEKGWDEVIAMINSGTEAIESVIDKKAATQINKSIEGIEALAEML
jgi:hypothetical protein